MAEDLVRVGICNNCGKIETDYESCCLCGEITNVRVGMDDMFEALYKYDAMFSELRKLVVKWRAEYRENYLASKGSAADELEEVINREGE